MCIEGFPLSVIAAPCFGNLGSMVDDDQCEENTRVECQVLGHKISATFLQLQEGGRTARPMILSELLHVGQMPFRNHRGFPFKRYRAREPTARSILPAIVRNRLCSQQDNHQRPLALLPCPKSWLADIVEKYVWSDQNGWYVISRRRAKKSVGRKCRYGRGLPTSCRRSSNSDKRVVQLTEMRRYQDSRGGPASSVSAVVDRGALTVVRTPRQLGGCFSGSGTSSRRLDSREVFGMTF